MSDYKPQIGDIISVPMKVVYVAGSVSFQAQTTENGSANMVYVSGGQTDHGPVELIYSPNLYFSGAKIGDKVWSSRYGYGELHKANQDVFDNICAQFAGDYTCYYANGKEYDGDEYQTLFYANDPRVAELKKILGVE